jgi:ketosteroid isomerase-like protein
METPKRKDLSMLSSQTRPDTGSTESIVEKFNDAFNRHDVDAIMALMTHDCVFENTFPAPDGERYQGQHDVRAFWSRLFHDTPTAHFETEDQFATDDRCAVRWRYTYTSHDGHRGHIRGVDIFRVRDGKVAEKMAYVKG